MKVLIVETDRELRERLQAQLAGLGHDPLATADPEEAWQVFQTIEPEVLFCQWGEQAVPGPQVCRRVRQEVRGYTYVVAMLRQMEAQQILDATRDGADLCVSAACPPFAVECALTAAERIVQHGQDLWRRKVELELENSELLEQVGRDPLTQLGNRLRLQEDLERLTAWVERYRGRFALAISDIDFFKAYNDSYGHVAGDELLRRIGRELLEELRKGDLVYRFGGDEFLVVLPEQTLVQGVAALERARKRIESLQIPHLEQSGSSVVTLTTGVTELQPGQDKDIPTLLQEADQALYLAKAIGRNRTASLADTSDPS